MHRALLVKDIILAVFDAIESTRTMLAFSLCAQHFLDLGMRAIWKHASEWKLALTMPKCFRKVVRVPNGSTVIMLSDEPRPEGWMGPRFLLYAGSIRSLSIETYGPHGSGCTVVHHSVIHAWVTYSIEKPTFYNLDNLMAKWDVDTAPTIIAAARSGVTGFSFYLPTYRPEEGSKMTGFLDDLKGASPMLQRVELRTQSDPLPEVMHALESCFATWTRLKEIELPYGPSATLVDCIATLPDLRTLILHLLTPPSLKSSSLFPALRFLRVYAYALPECVTFLRSISSTSLQHVDINLKATLHCAPDSSTQLFDALSRHSQIENLALRFNRGPTEHAYYPDEHDLRSLLKLRHVRKASLSINFGGTAANTLLRDFARAWPNLEQLSISMSPMTLQRNLAIPLHIFVDVLRACPLLKFFDIALDLLSPIPALDALEVQNDALVSLKFLTARYPPEEFDEAPLLAFVRAVCPGVRYVQGRAGYGRARSMIPQVLRMQAVLDALDT